MASKIIEAAKQAVEAAKCQHDLVFLPREDRTAPAHFDRYRCEKCKATMYVPIEPHYFGRS